MPSTTQTPMVRLDVWSSALAWGLLAARGYAATVRGQVDAGFVAGLASALQVRSEPPSPAPGRAVRKPVGRQLALPNPHRRT
jgi:hypothetical protein